jgi:hypothetical protein
LAGRAVKIGTIKVNQYLHTIFQASLVAWALLEGWIIVRDRWHPVTLVDRAGQGGIAIIMIVTFIITNLVDKSDPFQIPGRPVRPLLIQTPGQEYLQYAKHTKRLIPFIY